LTGAHIALVAREICNQRQKNNLNRLSNIVGRPGFSLDGLLGILNSSLFEWLYSTRFYDYEAKPVYLRTSPMGDTNNTRLKELVKRMLDLQKELDETSIPYEKKALKRLIDMVDNQIDQQVFELYAITEEEKSLMGLGEVVAGNRTVNS